MTSGPAAAHPGSGWAHYGMDFGFGLRLSALSPASVLPLLVQGLALATLTRSPRMLALVGAGSGLCLSGFAPPQIGGLAMATALAVATVLAIRGQELSEKVVQGASLLLPGLALAALYRGGSVDLPPAMILGSLAGAALLCLSARLAGWILLRVPGQVPALALRIAASWLAAVLILMLALLLSGQAGTF